MKITVSTCLFTVGNMNVYACQKNMVKSFANIKNYLFLSQLIISLNKNNKKNEKNEKNT